MDAKTQSRVRLTMHAIERHSQLLLETLDASLVELSPECVRWSAVCDPRCWLKPGIAWHAQCDMQRAITDLAKKYVLMSDELERFIRAGAAGHDCEAKYAFRDEFMCLTGELCSLLTQCIHKQETVEQAACASGIFPQYVPRPVPKAASNAWIVEVRPSTSAQATGGVE